MESKDIFLQSFSYIMTALVIAFIAFKPYNTICFNLLDSLLSIGSLFLALVFNIYVAEKYGIMRR